MLTTEELKQAYLEQGYSETEIEKILKSRKSVQEGQTISAEEMYKRLFVTELVHA